MWPFERSQRYQQVVDEEGEKEDSACNNDDYRPRNVGRTPLIAFVVVVSIVSALLAGLAIYTDFKSSTTVDDQQSGPEDATESADTNLSLSECAKRREWRTLSSSEQQEYISAVRCLRDQPSTLSFSSNGTSYDDFPWIHSHVGYYTHNSAPFLPWHRYFLHIYETTLRETCGYAGSLVYWDWTLDYDALEKSPVFSETSGFGGDGDTNGVITVGRSGRCVVNGPFKDISADYYDVKFKPHCLSRGFRDKTGGLGHIDGEDISPASIDAVLAIDKYEDFVASMESKVHDAIPFGIGGDFETFTAPYDPIFFLHHTQLDRLWWIWQQKSEKNKNEYGGHKHRHSIEMASLEDAIDMQGLAVSVPVSQVLDTEGELLCYKY